MISKFSRRVESFQFFFITLRYTLQTPRIWSVNSPEVGTFQFYFITLSYSPNSSKIISKFSWGWRLSVLLHQSDVYSPNSSKMISKFSWGWHLSVLLHESDVHSPNSTKMIKKISWHVEFQPINSPNSTSSSVTKLAGPAGSSRLVSSSTIDSILTPIFDHVLHRPSHIPKSVLDRCSHQTTIWHGLRAHEHDKTI